MPGLHFFTFSFYFVVKFRFSFSCQLKNHANNATISLESNTKTIVARIPHRCVCLMEEQMDLIVVTIITIFLTGHRPWHIRTSHSMYNAGEPVKRKVFMYAYTCVSKLSLLDQEPRKREINLSSTGQLKWYNMRSIQDEHNDHRHWNMK